MAVDALVIVVLCPVLGVVVWLAVVLFRR